MPPKTPRELREQIEREQAENPPAYGEERTAEGKEVPTPKRGDFFSHLEKVSGSTKRRRRPQ